MDEFTKKFSRKLAHLDASFSARFVSAGLDESVDDEIQILRHGKETGLAIQLGASYVGVEFWDEADESSLDIFHGGRLDIAKAEKFALGWCRSTLGRERRAAAKA